MARILIVESNSAELIEKAGASGRCGASDCFRRVLTDISPDVELYVCAPYVDLPDMRRYENIDAFVFTGSGVDWSTDAPEAAPLRLVMEQAFATGKPCYGSCNGMQLAAVVLGGRVAASPNGAEVGVVRVIRLDDDLNGHPMLSGRVEYFSVPTIHRDEVSELPSGAVHLACNQHTPHQAFAYSRDGVDFWGSQYHPEMRSIDVAGCLADQDSLFAGHATLMDDLCVAETDEDAAERLGTSTLELSGELRTLELQNWLRRVESVTASARVA